MVEEGRQTQFEDQQSSCGSGSIISFVFVLINSPEFLDLPVFSTVQQQKW